MYVYVYILFVVDVYIPVIFLCICREVRVEKDASFEVSGIRNQERASGGQGMEDKENWLGKGR